MTFPHGGPDCITQQALLGLVDAMDRLCDWHHAITGRDSEEHGGPCLRDIHMSPSGRLTALVTMEPGGGIVHLEYRDGRWEHLA